MRTTGIDHVVLTVADVERSIAWYQATLGVEALRLDQWRRGEVLFPSVRLAPGTVIDFLAGDRTGTNVDHVAVVVEDVDLQALADGGTVEVVAGPADLWGARGQGQGLYIRDPDGNVVELRTYPTESGRP